MATATLDDIRGMVDNLARFVAADPAAIDWFRESFALARPDGARLAVLPPATRKLAGSKADIRRVVMTAPGPLTGKQIARDLRGKYGASTVAKALGEMTTAGELVNPRDHRGYRLPFAAPAGGGAG